MDNKTPFIRLAKRENMSKGATWGIRIGSFVVALIIGAIIFAILGVSPITAYGQIIEAAFKRLSGFKQVIKYAVPLLGTGLALAPCFRMKYWNCGGEGQITMGAIFASYFALYWADKLPRPVLLLVCCAAGIVGGAIWSGIPALFKAKWGTNETLFTLMMNYIAIGIARWLQGGPWEGQPGSQIIPHFNKAAVLPKVWGIHIGWILVVVLAVVMFIYMTKTKHGYEVAVLGESENTARYAGMDVKKIIIRTALFSGAICGFVGYLICCGANGSLNAELAGGAGFTGITVCWLAQLNPFAMILISILMSALSKGASSLQTNLSVPASVSDIITGIILLCMLGSEFFINFRIVFNVGHKRVADESAKETQANIQADEVQAQSGQVLTQADENQPDLNRKEEQ